jgi:hypothetical protein
MFRPTLWRLMSACLLKETIVSDFRPLEKPT